MNPAEKIRCKDFIHAICLPFRISTRGTNESLKNITEHLKNTVWKAGPAPVTYETEIDQHELSESEQRYDSVWQSFRQHQQHAYFHPYVRRFLYNDNRTRRYHRSDIHTIESTLDHWSLDKFTVRLNVLRCELVLFQPDIGLLLLELQPKQPTELSLQQTQLLLDGLRRLYPPYVNFFKDDEGEHWAGGHCPVEVSLFDQDNQQIGETGYYRSDSATDLNHYTNALIQQSTATEPNYPWAAHWKSLLAPFSTDSIESDTPQIHQTGDDRAAIFSWIALDNPESIDRGNWMRLCFADQPGNDTLPYAKTFFDHFEKDYCYDRFWYSKDDSEDKPSRLMNSGYAFCWVGRADDQWYFTDHKNGAKATFRHIYIEMGVIAHFQKTALLVAKERLANLVSREDDTPTLPDQSKVREFYDHFVEFTQNYWFDEISPQEQGRELFHMWRKHLRVQELYDETRQELRDLVEYTELTTAHELNIKANELNKRVFGLGFLSLFLGFMAFFVGVFGMNEFEPNWVMKMGLVLLVAVPLIVAFGISTTGILTNKPHRLEKDTK